MRAENKLLRRKITSHTKSDAPAWAYNAGGGGRLGGDETCAGGLASLGTRHCSLIVLVGYQHWWVGLRNGSIWSISVHKTV